MLIHLDSSAAGHYISSDLTQEVPGLQEELSHYYQQMLASSGLNCTNGLDLQSRFWTFHFCSLVCLSTCNLFIKHSNYVTMSNVSKMWML